MRTALLVIAALGVASPAWSQVDTSSYRYPQGPSALDTLHQLQQLELQRLQIQRQRMQLREMEDRQLQRQLEFEREQAALYRQRQLERAKAK